MKAIGKPKAVIMICADVDSVGDIHEIRYLNIFPGRRLVYQTEAFTGSHSVPSIGMLQQISVKQACERWPYMAMLIKASTGRKPPRFVKTCQ